MLAGNANAQKAKPDTLMSLPLFYASGGFDLVGGDIAKQFTNNFEIGGGFLYKTKSNWLFGADFNFIFNDSVKYLPIQGILTREGFLIGEDGLYTNLRITERGYKLPVFKAGKIFSAPIGRASVNSGLYLMGGLGFLQHRIHYEDVSRTASQLRGNYKKGYDHLTNGLALTENIGYMFLDKNRRINFFVCLEFTQAFTKNRRDYNFDLRGPDHSQKTDLLYGIKLGWIFPAYKKIPQEYYYD